MPSILTSGVGLDGVQINIDGAFAKLGSTNAGLCTAGTNNSKMQEAVTPVIYQGADADLAALHSATSGTTRQPIFLNAGGISAANDFRVGVEVALGDQGAREDGDLHAITKHSEVIATGWSMLRDGRWMSPTGAVVSILPVSVGTGISLGSDNTTGVVTEYWFNQGGTSLGNISLTR